MIGELNELFSWCKAGTAGWRFLLSRRFRAKTLAEWKIESWHYIAGEIICGVAGIALSLAVLFALFFLVAELQQS